MAAAGGAVGNLAADNAKAQLNIMAGSILPWVPSDDARLLDALGAHAGLAWDSELFMQAMLPVAVELQRTVGLLLERGRRLLAANWTPDQPRLQEELQASHGM